MEKERMMMTKLLWVTLKVSDLERSLAFYNGLLHLEVAARFGDEHHQIVMLGEAQGPKVELICEPGASIQNPGNGVSVGLEVEEIDKLVDQCKERGCSVTGPISPNPHIRFFFVQDPDGYTVQLIEQK